jgi:hypothetical protein
VGGLLVGTGQAEACGNGKSVSSIDVTLQPMKMQLANAAFREEAGMVPSRTRKKTTARMTMSEACCTTTVLSRIRMRQS